MSVPMIMSWCPGDVCDPCLHGLTGIAIVAVGHYDDALLGHAYAMQVNISVNFTMVDGSTETNTTTASGSAVYEGGPTTAPVKVNQYPFGPPSGGPYSSYVITSPAAYIVFPGFDAIPTRADVSGLTIR